MGIIGSMAAQAFFDSKNIVGGQVSLLEAELEEMTLPKPVVTVLAVGEQVSAGEAAKESMKLWGGNLRVDHILQAGIQHHAGPIAMIQQYSRANAFPCEFRMELPVGAPATVSLRPQILSKAWEAHEVQEDDEVAKAFVEALDELLLHMELEWTQSLPGNMTMDVGWGAQIIPTGPESCTLLVQTARKGFFTETLGVKEAAQMRAKVLELLQGWTGGTTEPLPPLDWAASLQEMPVGVPLAEFLEAPKQDAAAAAPKAEPGATSATGDVALAAKAPEEPAGPVGQGPNSVLAAILSFFFPGVGQIISGQVGKGILMLVVFFVLCGLGGLLNVVAAIDAYLIAEKKNAGKPVGEWDFF
jgi:hypothetical protein